MGIKRDSTEVYEILEKVGIFSHTPIAPDAFVLLTKKILELEKRINALEQGEEKDGYNQRKPRS